MIAKGCWLEWEQDHCWVYQSSAAGLRRVAGYSHASQLQPSFVPHALASFLPRLRTQLGMPKRTDALHLALPAQYFEALVVRVPAFHRSRDIPAYLKAVLSTELKAPISHYSWRQWQYAKLSNGESLWVLLSAPLQALRQMVQQALAYDFTLKGVYPTHLLEWLQSALLLGMKEGCQAVVVARYHEGVPSGVSPAHAAPSPLYRGHPDPFSGLENNPLDTNPFPWDRGQVGYLERLAQNPLPSHWRHMNTLEATPWWWRVTYAATPTAKGARRWVKAYALLALLALLSTLAHQHCRGKAHMQQAQLAAYQQHLHKLGQQHRVRSGLDAALGGMQSWQAQRASCLQHLKALQAVLAAVPAVWLSALEWSPGAAATQLELSFVEPSLGDLWAGAHQLGSGASQCAQVTRELGTRYQVSLLQPTQTVPELTPAVGSPLPCAVRLSLQPLP
jgi:hypothetical protein